MTSKHSLRRAKERIGISKTMAMRTIEKAEDYGLTSDYFSGDERAYLQHKEGTGLHTVVYEGFCYLFSQDMKCITVMELPSWFEEKKRYDHKTEIRNYRTYRQHYPEKERDEYRDEDFYAA